MFKQWTSRLKKVAWRLPLVIVALSLLMAAGVGGISYFQAQQTAEKQITTSLGAVVESRTQALQGYLESIEEDLRIAAGNLTVKQAMTDFTRAWRELPGDPQEALQRLYIAENPHPTGQKENLDAASDGSSYSLFHGRYHPWFRDFLRERGYYDIFLFDLDGNLIYTVFKELDYATNLVHGEWRDTDLGKAFRAAKTGSGKGEIHFFDFQAYGPSHGAPASFISTSIPDEAGTPAGVLVFQMPIDRINATLSSTTGLGDTGESYILGQDRLMRSQSRFFEENTILHQQAASEAALQALAGEEGVVRQESYRGHSVYAAYRPFAYRGTNWAVVAEVSSDEVLAPVRQMGLMMLLVSIAFLLILAATGAWVVRRLTTSLHSLTEVMGAFAEGEFEHDVPGKERVDELGQMARCLEVFRENGKQNLKLRQEQVDMEQRAEEQRAAALERMAETVETQTKEIVERVSSVADQTREKADLMSMSSEKVSGDAEEVAKAASLSLANSQTVADATRELTASIQEISSQVVQATDVTRNAVEKSESSRVILSDLADAVEDISQVTAGIADIAEKTNLLALNATIESARAGDAGKGFAVVASEVKSLANQTATLTDRISQQVEAVHKSANQSLEAFGQIGERITEIDQISGSISVAIEEQSAIAGEISRAVGETASAAEEVSGLIHSVSDESKVTYGESVEVKKNLTQVGDAVGDLQHSLVKIVRSATREVDRRGNLRVTSSPELECSVDVGNKTLTGRLVNLSVQGALIRLDEEILSNQFGTFTLHEANLTVGFVVVETIGPLARLLFRESETIRREILEIMEMLDADAQEASTG